MSCEGNFVIFYQNKKQGWVQLQKFNSTPTPTQNSSTPTPTPIPTPPQKFNSTPTPTQNSSTPTPIPTPELELELKISTPVFKLAL